MLLKVLIENTACSEEFHHEHGLSLYLEANGKKMLFDVGASDLFYDWKDFYKQTRAQKCICPLMHSKNIIL